ncbi:MAG: alpha/beta hydrolase [Desulfuromonadales bacterium]
MKTFLGGFLFALLFFSGVGRAYCAMEYQFVYFPARTIDATPEDYGLDFEDIRFEADDGTSLHGWFLPGEPHQPLVLFCHGNAGNISHRIDNLRKLHHLGVGVFIFDYRGYGRSEGRASEEGTYDDARGALSWLRSRGWSTEKLVYFGRSLGASVALQLAVEEPPAAVVLESAFTSIRALGWRHNPILTFLLGWLLDARYDNADKIKKLRSPLLFIHGGEDTIVPPDMGRRLFDMAPEPKHFFLRPEADHNTPLPPTGAPYWQAWRNFLDGAVTTTKSPLPEKG